jgi:hypothetical protein
MTGSGISHDESEVYGPVISRSDEYRCNGDTTEGTDAMPLDRCSDRRKSASEGWSSAGTRAGPRRRVV